MKVLIWDKDYTLKNVGGPTGYMYNLHEYLKNKNDNEIDFYSDVMNRNKEEKLNNETLFHRIFHFLVKHLKCIDLLASLSVYFTHRRMDAIDMALLGKYDYVHLHSMFQFYSYFVGQNSQSKVILTIHYPEPAIDELFSTYGYKWILNCFPFIRNYFIRKEIRILEEVDYMMFPVKEATEAYMLSSKLYKDFFKRSNYKFFYVPSALFPSERIIPDKDLSLASYEIHKESLKLCFIGRHNKIKGYDKLKDIAKEIWKTFPNVYFVIGGTEAPLKRLEDKRWIELGWVNTNEVLEQVDAFILPNKQTYFDLVLLEVLRQGKFCVISNTGGNKWFSQFKKRGIRIYDNEQINTILPIVSDIIQYKNKSELMTIEKENREFFKEHFSCESFFKKYKEEVSKLK